MSNYKTFPHKVQFEITRKQEQVIDDVLGIEMAALRESWCLPLLEGREFSPLEALESLVGCLDLGLFPRWEILQIIATASRALLADPSGASLDKKFGSGRRGRPKQSDDRYRDIAHYLVVDGMALLAACEKVCRIRKLPVSPENLAQQYKRSGRERYEEQARSSQNGAVSPALAHLRAAMNERQRRAKSKKKK